MPIRDGGHFIVKRDGLLKELDCLITTCTNQLDVASAASGQPVELNTDHQFNMPIDDGVHGGHSLPLFVGESLDNWVGCT